MQKKDVDSLYGHWYHRQEAGRWPLLFRKMEKEIDKQDKQSKKPKKQQAYVNISDADDSDSDCGNNNEDPQAGGSNDPASKKRKAADKDENGGIKKKQKKEGPSKATQKPSSLSSEEKEAILDKVCDVRLYKTWQKKLLSLAKVRFILQTRLY